MHSCMRAAEKFSPSAISCPRLLDAVVRATWRFSSASLLSASHTSLSGWKKGQNVNHSAGIPGYKTHKKCNESLIGRNQNFES